MNALFEFVVFMVVFINLDFKLHFDYNLDWHVFISFGICSSEFASSAFLCLMFNCLGTSNR